MAQGDSRQLVRQETPRTDIVETTERDPEQIRRDIEAARRQVTESLGQLRTEMSTTVEQVSSTVERTLDWRGWVQEHPYSSLGVAFGIGLYFGLR